MVVSWLFLFQIFWSEFWSEIKQSATDRSYFQSEKQKAMSNSRSRLLLIKILKEFSKNYNRRNKIIWYSFRILHEFFKNRQIIFVEKNRTYHPFKPME